jgi:adiponectin receptor
MYAGLGFSAVVFILHGIILHGWSVQNRRMSLDWMVLMASLNLVGAGFYAARVRISTMYTYGAYN